MQLTHSLNPCNVLASRAPGMVTDKGEDLGSTLPLGTCGSVGEIKLMYWGILGGCLCSKAAAKILNEDSSLSPL